MVVFTQHLSKHLTSLPYSGIITTLDKQTEKEKVDENSNLAGSVGRYVLEAKFQNSQGST